MLLLIITTSVSVVKEMILSSFFCRFLDNGCNLHLFYRTVVSVCCAYSRLFGEHARGACMAQTFRISSLSDRSSVLPRSRPEVRRSLQRCNDRASIRASIHIALVTAGHASCVADCDTAARVPLPGRQRAASAQDAQQRSPPGKRRPAPRPYYLSALNRTRFGRAPSSPRRRFLSSSGVLPLLATLLC